MPVSVSAVQPLSKGTFYTVIGTALQIRWACLSKIWAAAFQPSGPRRSSPRHGRGKILDTRQGKFDDEAAAPHASLAFMFWGAGLFVFPFMLFYTAVSYIVFRGKVRSVPGQYGSDQGAHP
jgi:hypothetical protein